VVPKPLRIFAAAVSAVVLLAVITVAALIGLNAECNGAAGECPRSDAYRGALIALPVASFVLLLAGGVWSLRRRAVAPLVLAEAAVLGVAVCVDALVNELGLETAVLLLASIGIGWAALSHGRGQ
jgi:hypothetical protein